MRKAKWVWWLLVAAGSWLTARPVTAGLIDPTGDTFGAGSVRLDIVRYRAELDAAGAITTFTIEFAGPVAPASRGAPNSVFGFIDIDTDRDPTTGNPNPFINQFGGAPPVRLGSERYISFLSEVFHPGLVDVADAVTGRTLGTVPVSYTDTGLSLAVPQALLGGGVSLVDYTVLVRTALGATDRAPNGTLPATSVPEPGTALLLALGGTAVGCYLGRRRH